MPSSTGIDRSDLGRIVYCKNTKDINSNNKGSPPEADCLKNLITNSLLDWISCFYPGLPAPIHILHILITHPNKGIACQAGPTTSLAIHDN